MIELRRYFDVMGDAECDMHLDSTYSEHIAIRELNLAAIQLGTIDDCKAKRELDRLPVPWIVKDPRFISTLRFWLPIFESYQPLLIWLTRDLESLKQSYRRRQGLSTGEPSSRGQTIEDRLRAAKSAFESWPWSKLRLSLEDVSRAVSLFDSQRVGKHFIGGIESPNKARPRSLEKKVDNSEHPP